MKILSHTPMLSHARLLATALAALLAMQLSIAAEADSDDDNEEVITLAEFQVSEKALKDSYIATEITAGTRTGEKIGDIPYAVQVFTEDFINDFQLFEEEDLYPFISGATGMTGDAADSLTVRGFRALRTRDGFSNSIPSTPTNTLRTEIIKGPRSTEYGRASPGGIINNVARRPLQRGVISATATIGANDYRRFTLNATGPVFPKYTKKKLYYYAYYEKLERDGASTLYKEDHLKTDKQFFGLSLLYKFSKYTSLYLTAESQPDKSTESGGAVYITHAGDAKRTRGWTGIGGFSQKWAPNAYVDRKFHGANALFEHRINSVWSTRVAIQLYRKETYKQRWMGADSYRWSNNGTGAYRWEFNERSPYLRNDDDKSIASQAELLANFKTYKVTPLEHRILITADTAAFNRSAIERTLDATSKADPNILPLRTRFMSMDDPYFMSFDYSRLRENRTNYYLQQRTYGALLSYRARSRATKLSFMSSLRYEYFKDTVENRKVFNSGERTEKPFTYSVGLNYYLLGEKLMFYVSSSSGYQPVGPSGSDARIDRGSMTLLPAQESTGIETGIKGSTDKGLFSYTLSLFKLKIKNVSFINGAFNENLHLGENTVPEYFSDNKYDSEGVDAQFFLKPTDSFLIIGALGYTKTEATDASNVYALGKPMLNVAKWNAALTFRYSFKSGILKGTNMGFSAQFRDRYLRNYEHNSYYEYELPSLLQCSAFTSYEWKTWKLTHKISLRVSNLLDKKFYTANGREGLGINGRISYNIKY